MRLKCTTGGPKRKIHITFHIYLKTFEKPDFSSKVSSYINCHIREGFFPPFISSPKINHIYILIRLLKFDRCSVVVH